MKRENERRLVAATALAFALTIAATSSGFGKPADPAYRFDRHGKTRPIPYVGDCGPHYPPGYCHDLKDWRSGFTDRDFSCYMLDNG